MFICIQYVYIHIIHISSIHIFIRIHFVFCIVEVERAACAACDIQVFVGGGDSDGDDDDDGGGGGGDDDGGDCDSVIVVFLSCCLCHSRYRL